MTKPKTMTWVWNGQTATLADVQAQVGPGWSQLLSDLVDDLFSLGWTGSLAQVKEKFGRLRFYVYGGNDAVFDRIEKAELESGTICEYCGKAGELRNLRWITTLCNECLAKQ